MNERISNNLKKGGYEEGEPPDSLSSVMDLRNNEAGFVLGNLKKDLSLEELSKEVINEILKGNGWIMKRKKTGQYLDCNDKTIDLAKYKGSWFIPKCLVESDKPYID